MLATSCQYFYCKMYIIYRSVLYYFLSNKLLMEITVETLLATVAVSMLL